MGKTQNLNESAHQKVWNRLNKTKFFGLRTIQQSAVLTALQHNFGYKEGCPLSNFGFGAPAKATDSFLEMQDRERRRHSLEVRVSSKKEAGEPVVTRKRKRAESDDEDYAPGAY